MPARYNIDDTKSVKYPEIFTAGVETTAHTCVYPKTKANCFTRRIFERATPKSKEPVCLTSNFRPQLELEGTDFIEEKLSIILQYSKD